MKKVFFNSKKLLFFFIVFFSTLQTKVYSFGVDTMNLSPAERAEMEKFEKELIEATKAIEEVVAQMSPEEQEEFNKAVEEMTKMLEEMPEEELDNFLEDLFSTEFNDSTIQELEKTPEKSIDTEKTEPEVIVSLDEFKDTISLLDSITKQLNLLLVKISSSPDVPNKLVHWRIQNKIAYWSNDISWQAMLTMIEQLITDLFRMKKVDAKTKKALFLPSIKENKSLINNLTELNTQLLQTVPAIEIPAFGTNEKMSDTSKKLLQKAMTTVAEYIFVIKISTIFNEIEEKLQPEMQKLILEEERLEKRAAERLVKPIRTSRTIVAGKEESGYSTGGNFLPTPISSPSKRNNRSSFAYNPSSKQRRNNFFRDPSSIPSSKKGTLTDRNNTKEKDDDMLFPQNNSKELSNEEQVTKQKKGFTNKTANQKLENIVGMLSQLSEIIMNNVALRNIVKYVFKPLKADAIPVDIQSLQLNKTILLIIDELNTLYTQIKTVSTEEQALYQNEIKTKTEEYFKIIEKLVRDIEKIHYEKNKKKIDPKIQLFYFLEETVLQQQKEANKDNKEIFEQLEQFPKMFISLLKIQENIKTLLKKINDLSYKQTVKMDADEKEQIEDQKDDEFVEKKDLINEEEPTEQPDFSENPDDDQTPPKKSNTGWFGNTWNWMKSWLPI